LSRDIIESSHIRALRRYQQRKRSATSACATAEEYYLNAVEKNEQVEENRHVLDIV
jgi:hypothetical protein